MKIIADTNIPFVEGAFSTLGNVETCEGRTLSARQLAEAEILLVRSVTAVNQSLLSNSLVRFVGSATIGVDHIDEAFLKSQSIKFANAPGSNATSAAEYVIAGLVLMSQRMGFSLQNKLVGVIGCGNVGSRVVERLQGLGADCIVNDPPRQQTYGDREYVSFDEVVQADIITVHVPLIRNGEFKTYHMFDESIFSTFKPNSIFINTSRGSVVNQAGLHRVLKSRNDIHLILDVWENEPGIDIELLKKAQIATPHIAGYSLDGKVRGTEMLYTSACDYFQRPVLWSSESTSLASHKTIDFTDSTETDQDKLLLSAVSSAYDISKDDYDLRQILLLDAASQAKRFDQLRKNYPVRREFSNHTVRLSHKFNTLGEKLKAIGFDIEYDS